MRLSRLLPATAHSAWRTDAFPIAQLCRAIFPALADTDATAPNIVTCRRSEVEERDETEMAAKYGSYFVQFRAQNSNGMGVGTTVPHCAGTTTDAKKNSPRSR